MSAPIDSAASAPASATPAMRQYFDAKRQHRDAIMFFRMGDFYEMFYEDALVAARALELTLTSRSKDASGGAIPMCGVPYHAADGYIARLVRQGFRVAVCEQVEDPRKAKGIVRREVIRVVSPGTLTDASYLDAREPAFIMSIAGPASPEGMTGVALVDLSTGEFSAAEYAGREGLADDLATLRPREVVVAAGLAGGPSSALPPLPNMPLPRLTEVEPWTFDAERARRTLLDQLRTHTLAGFGLEGHPAASAAAGALVQYLKDTQKVDLAHVRAIAFRAGGDALIVDPTTARHLEIVEAAAGGRAGSLLEEVDRTITSMRRPPAARLAAPSTGVARAHPGAARRGRGACVPGDRVAAGCARRSNRSTTSNGSSRERRSARPGLAISLHFGSRSPPFHGSACCWPICRRRSSSVWPARWTMWRRCGTRLRRRSWMSRRRSRATAARSATASIPSSTTFAASAAAASSASPTWRPTSGRGPASARSRSATTGSSATTSRCRSRISARFRPITCRKQTIAGGERFITPALKEYEEQCSWRGRTDPGARARDLRPASRRRGRGSAEAAGHRACPRRAGRPVGTGGDRQRC